MQLDDTVGAAAARRDPTSPAPTGEALLGGIDTAQLRNRLARTLFGATIDPIRIGRFLVLRRIGEGGMGVVYAAYDDRLDRKIAVKLLGGRHEASSEELRVRLQREAKALARLSHPGVISVYETGDHDGQVYVAMEFVQGVTLRQWVLQQRRSVAEIVARYIEAGRGLAAAHAAGLVHRDFKPDNAMVGDDGRVRVLDFGLAWSPQDGDPVTAATAPPADDLGVTDRLTRSGTMLGTPAYMAPEQLAGRAADARSDQFSFAVALFEAVWGRRPFVGTDLAGLSAAVQAGRLALPEGTSRHRRLLRVIRRALASDPAARYPSMDVLVDELRSASSTWGIKLGLGLAAAAIAIGVTMSIYGAELGAMQSRTEDLSQAVSSERSRADAAESDLVRRADALTLAEARQALDDDPTRAIAILATLRDAAPAWADLAWGVAVQAAHVGIAHRVVAAPADLVSSKILGDGSVLAYDEEERIYLWSADGPLRPLPPEVTDVTHDGTSAVLVGSRGLERLDLRSGTREQLAPAADHCVSEVFSADGSHVAAICGTGELRAWGPAGLVHRRAGMMLAIYALANDGSFVLVHGGDGLQVVDLAGGRVHDVASPSANVVGVTGDGEHAITIEGHHVRSIARDGTVRDVVIDSEITSAATALRGGEIAIATIGGEVELVASATGAVTPFEGQQGSAILRVRWSADGRHLTSDAVDGTVGVWDVAGRTLVSVARSSSPAVSSLWRDGELLVASVQELRYHAPATEIVDRDVVATSSAAGADARAYADGRVRLMIDGQAERELDPLPGIRGLRVTDGGEFVVAHAVRDGRGLSFGAEIGPARSVVISTIEREGVLGSYGPDGFETLVSGRRPTARFAVDAQRARVAWQEEHEIVVRDLRSGEQGGFAVPAASFVDTLAFAAATGELLVLGWSETGERVTEVMDPRDPVPGRSLPVSHVDGAQSASWTTIEHALDTRDAEWSLLLESDVHGWRLYDPTTGSSLPFASNGLESVQSIAIDPDREFVALRTDTGSVRLHALGRNGLDALLPPPGTKHDDSMLSSARVMRLPCLNDLTMPSGDAVLELRCGVLRRHRIAPPRDAVALRAWVRAATDLALVPARAP